MFKNNYVTSVTRSLGELLRWQWQRRRAGLPLPPKVPTPRQDPDLQFLVENARAGAGMANSVTWIGHATTLVQAGGLNVLTDPVFSKRVSPIAFLGPVRAHPPALAIEQLPVIDVVVISHNHYDHLDDKSIRRLSAQAGGCPLFLVPLGIKAWLAKRGITRAVELDWWGLHEHAGVEFYFTPAQHWSGRSFNDRNKTLWGSWVAMSPECHWFFSGDTGYSRDFGDIYERFAARQGATAGGGFDMGLIAVGACEPRWFMKPQHVDPAEAVQIHLDIRAKRSLGIHWGTFQLSDEPLDHAIDAVATARKTFGLSEAQFGLLALGETRRFARRA